MNIRTPALRLLAPTLLLSLAACSPPAPADGNGTQAAAPASGASSSASDTGIASEVRKGIDQAKQQLATENIDVARIHFGNHDKDDHDASSKLPKAQITPQGELLIAGKPVPATPAQHALVLDYRQQLLGFVSAAMDIGSSGADVGIAAAKQAILGVFSGKSDKEIEASIKPQTDAIQAAAMQLCKRLPELLVSQQKLAAAMPAFQPYATMTQKDVDDCGKDTDKNGKHGVAVFSD